MDIVKRKDIMIFALIVILALIIGKNVIYKNNLDRIHSLKAQIEEEKNKNDALEMISVLDRRLKAYQNSSFSTTEITEVLDKISQLAERSDISVQTFNPLPAERRKHYIEISLKLPISCDYHRLGRFFSLIESNPQVIRIKQLNMQKPTIIDPRKTAIPKVDLTISGLYLKQ